MLTLCPPYLISLKAAQDSEAFDNNSGLFCMYLNVTGWLVDWTGEFSAAFYLAGLCFILSAIFVVIVDRLVERKISNLVKVADDAADSETCPVNEMDHLEV